MEAIRDVDSVYSSARESLIRAFDRSEMLDVDEYLLRCKRDQAQLWGNGSFWMITEVADTKSGRALNIVAIAGDYDEDLWRSAEVWGKSVGCIRAFVTGRLGWIKRKPDYTVRTVTLSKEL